MDKPINITVTREELYNLVWSKPLTKLSEEFGLSDVGLSKTCKRHNIPTPPVGYWAKLANGHTTLQIPLPPASNEAPKNIECQIDKRKEEEIAKRENYSYVYQEYGCIIREGIELKKAKSLDALHPLLREAYKNKSTTSPSIYVSDHLRERAYRFAHTLFNFLEAQGFKIDIQQSDRSTSTTVKINNTAVGIIINEKSKRVEATKSKKPYSFLDSKYEFVPSGLITFKAGQLYLSQKEWTDSKTGLIEDKIFDIADGILAIAIKERIHSLELEDRHRQYKERERAETKELLRLQQQKQEIDELLNNANNWKNSILIKEYVSAVKTNAETNGAMNDKTTQWVAWALNESKRMINLEPFNETDIEGKHE